MRKKTKNKSASKKKAQNKSTSKKKAQNKSASKKKAPKKKSAPKKKTASKKKSAPKKKTASKKKAQNKSASKKKAAPKKKAPKKKSAATKKKAPHKSSQPTGNESGGKGASKKPASGASATSEAGGGKTNASGAKKGAQKGPVVRKPAHAEELKDKLGKLAQARTRIRSLKRSLDKSFFDIGTILAELEDASLHEVKGYGSFEAFLEREIDLGAQQALRLVRIARSLQPEAATRAGLERSEAALAALEGEDDESSRFPFGSPIPPHKR